MAKNRRVEPASVRFGPAVKALFLCAFIVASGVGYLWQKSQLQALGRDITERERRLGDLRRQNQAMKDHLAGLCAPAALDARARNLNLGLMPPPVTQIVRLYEPAPPAPVPSGDARHGLASP
jgi:hypothetical protein